MAQPLVGAPGAPPGRGLGKPGFPVCSPQAPCAGTQHRDEHGVSLGGPPPPWPSPAGGGNRAPPPRQGVGEPRVPHVPTAVGGACAPPGRGLGKPGFSVCSHQAPCAGAQHRAEHGVSLGGPPPPWPSPAGGGNRAPPLREGVGETRFPHVPTAVGGAWRPSRQGGGSTSSPQAGKPGFPVCSPQPSMRPRRTTQE